MQTYFFNFISVFVSFLKINYKIKLVLCLKLYIICYKFCLYRRFYFINYQEKAKKSFFQLGINNKYVETIKRRKVQNERHFMAFRQSATLLKRSVIKVKQKRRYL